MNMSKSSGLLLHGTVAQTTKAWETRIFLEEESHLSVAIATIAGSGAIASLAKGANQGRDKHASSRSVRINSL